MSKTLPSLEARLRDAALAYLERYESSTQSLRRVLRRRLLRWAAAEGRPAEGRPAEERNEEAVEAVIGALRRAGLVDDARYAGVKARSLFRDGRSGRAIGAYLAARGVPEPLIAEALEGRAEERDSAGDPDLDAALRFARKKRLGRFRPAGDRAARRDRDMAALGRAGFSWRIARTVVDEEM